ncbi:MAG: hypothetical protein EBZ48_08790, partial [Proteobacteria bacterium]|nr:hypothetical protein [Pseudomonadota bacterium]
AVNPNLGTSDVESLIENALETESYMILEPKQAQAENLLLCEQLLRRICSIHHNQLAWLVSCAGGLADQGHG